MSFLERSKAGDILLNLLDGPKHLTELQSLTGGSLTTIEVRVKELIHEGLVAEEEMKKWPFKRILKLTEKGLNATLSLQNISGTVVRLPKERQKWILALLHAMGQVKGSTRLVKLLFLLSQYLQPTPAKFYAFSKYKYGPYDSEIMLDIRELQNLGLLEIEEEIFDEDAEDYKRRVNYSLTERGELLAEKVYRRLSENEQRVIRSLKKYNIAPLQDLLKYIYSEFKDK